MQKTAPKAPHKILGKYSAVRESCWISQAECDLEQKYLKNEGRVDARILTANQAEATGYEDGYKSSRAEYKLYVDGFDSIDAIQNYVSDLANCTLIE